MAKEKHAVVRTDNMYGTDVRAGLVSIKYFDDNDKPAAIDNGNVLKVGELLAIDENNYEREIFKGTKVDADDELKDVVLLVGVEVMYDERLNSLDDYYNEANKAIRGYRFHDGQIFSVTKEALAGKEEPAIGDVVELAAGTKMNVAASATDGATKVGRIIAIDKVGRFTYYAILVG